MTPGTRALIAPINWPATACNRRPLRRVLQERRAARPWLAGRYERYPLMVNVSSHGWIGCASPPLLAI